MVKTCNSATAAFTQNVLAYKSTSVFSHKDPAGLYYQTIIIFSCICIVIYDGQYLTTVLSVKMLLHIA